jgi:hypothetical protein
VTQHTKELGVQSTHALGSLGITRNNLCWWTASLVWAGLLVAPAHAQLGEKEIAALRAQGDQEGWTFTVGENDATRYPLEQLCGLVEPPGWRERAVVAAGPSEQQVRALPSSYDWRNVGGVNYLTPVRNQGGCGSCWAFAAVGAFESAIKRSDGMDVDLSEQWLVSCTSAGTCQGGWHTEALDQMMCVGSGGDPCRGLGAVMESAFPYVAWDAPCQCPYMHPYCVSGWVMVGGSTSAIKQAIYDHGPVAVTVYASNSFQGYTGGVYNACPSGSLNHAVVLVGWNDANGGYWIMRNSWGAGWGESGYMRIRYNCSGIGTNPVYVQYTPVDCNGNGTPDRVEVANGTAPDCNGNYVPDECELAAGTVPDCNGNGIPDSCDIASGLFQDCNTNGVPDVCELAGQDCNGNGVLDACDIAAGLLPDCNGNGVPDGCEIAQGLATDCNGNGIPDICDLTAAYRVMSPVYAPVGYGHEFTFTLAPVQLATGDVTLHLWATGDLNFYNKNVAIYFNDVLATTAFTGVAYYCEPSTDDLVVAKDVFNAAAASGAVNIRLVPSDSVNGAACPSSRLQFEVSYPAVALGRDCNGNGTLDDCDILAGRSQDTDHNGIPDECVPPADCPGDSNCDGLVNWRDIDYLIAGMNDNQAAWRALFAGNAPACAYLNCDSNVDQHVNWRDIDSFIAKMNTACP